jgi:hypothetical protein
MNCLLLSLRMLVNYVLRQELRPVSVSVYRVYYVNIDNILLWMYEV